MYIITFNEQGFELDNKRILFYVTEEDQASSLVNDLNAKLEILKSKFEADGVIGCVLIEQFNAFIISTSNKLFFGYEKAEEYSSAFSTSLDYIKLI